MKKLELFKPILIHILINLFAIITLNIIESFNTLSITSSLPSLYYITFSIFMVFLYLFSSKFLLKQIPFSTTITSIFIILLLNLFLGISGYLMMTFGSEIVAENGQLPILLLITLNCGFYPILSLSSLPELINILLISMLSPLLILLGRIYPTKIDKNTSL